MRNLDLAAARGTMERKAPRAVIGLLQYLEWSNLENSSRRPFKSQEPYFVDVQCFHHCQVPMCRGGKALQAFCFLAFMLLLALNININNLKPIVLCILLEKKKTKQSCSFRALIPLQHVPAILYATKNNCNVVLQCGVCKISLLGISGWHVV